MRKFAPILALAVLPLAACGHSHYVVHRTVVVHSHGYVGQPLPAARIPVARRVVVCKKVLRRSRITGRPVLVKVCR
jgi:hypothetical protein